MVKRKTIKNIIEQYWIYPANINRYDPFQVAPRIGIAQYLPKLHSFLVCEEEKKKRKHDNRVNTIFSLYVFPVEFATILNFLVYLQQILISLITKQSVIYPTTYYLHDYI